ncbi:hypothetical protein BJ508DRAFT_20595 [Ascobolus immersus RN42]|uniref:Uncharacterized protein n=1 Tax=Ascobolus immersus RN42 TaxID=1160509 RepID=A0A3N4ILF5_ASCIM|nr:hypothetical protein BJ508DRAFT_20595 [Ascobolus immersus RN42]
MHGTYAKDIEAKQRQKCGRSIAVLLLSTLPSFSAFLDCLNWLVPINWCRARPKSPLCRCRSCHNVASGVFICTLGCACSELLNRPRRVLPELPICRRCFIA